VNICGKLNAPEINIANCKWRLTAEDEDHPLLQQKAA